MKEGWRYTELGMVADLLNGDRGKNYPSAKHRVSSGIPFINAGHLDSGRVRMSGMDFITPEHYAMLRGGKVQQGDVLLCIRGSLGRAALVTSDVAPAAIASSLVIVRPHSTLVSRYLLAFFESPIGAQQVISSDNGSAQPNIGARDVAKFLIPIPSPQIQYKIAAVLSAYDELIENNTRRIVLLEEMAKAIYRE
jgi:type I restriction enzyme S subunit